MKKVAPLTLLTFVFFMTSCVSEYEECMEEGKELMERLHIVEESYSLVEDDQLIEEMKMIKSEINLLARVSGDEKLFLNQVYAE